MREKTISIWSIINFHQESFSNKSYKQKELKNIPPFEDLKVWEMYKRLGSWSYEMFDI